MKSPTRTWKRTLLTLSLFILAGAIINVAVAWGCVFLVEPEKYQVRDRSAVDRDVLQRGFPSDSSDTIRGAEQHGLGVSISGNSLNSSDHQRRPSLWLVITKAGLPLYSVEADWRGAGRPGAPIYNTEFAKSPYRFQATGGLQLSPEHRYFGFTPLLPYKPIWPGFAINTIFYAGILWLLFTAPGFVRRRIRIKRGLCPACAYPVGSSDVCTECGAPVRIQKP